MGGDEPWLTRIIGGLPASFDYGVIRGGKNSGEGPRRWMEVWSAGHSISGVRSIAGVAELVEELVEQYEAAFANSAR